MTMDTITGITTPTITPILTIMSMENISMDMMSMDIITRSLTRGATITMARARRASPFPA